jgi:hypothetical protein
MYVREILFLCCNEENESISSDRNYVQTGLDGYQNKEQMHSGYA